MLHVVSDRVHPVRGADRAAVAVAHHDEHREIGAMQLDARRDRQRAAVNAVETVRLEVMREPARAADAGDEHRLLGLELFGDEQLLDRGEHRVVAAAGTPAGDRSLVVAEHEFAVIVLPGTHPRAVHESSLMAQPPCRASISSRDRVDDRAGSKRLARHARPAVDVDERLRHAAAKRAGRAADSRR